jgi:hypothetical protein
LSRALRGRPLWTPLCTTCSVLLRGQYTRWTECCKAFDRGFGRGFGRAFSRASVELHTELCAELLQSFCRALVELDVLKFVTWILP